MNDKIEVARTLGSKIEKDARNQYKFLSSILIPDVYLHWVEFKNRSIICRNVAAVTITVNPWEIREGQE